MTDTMILMRGGSVEEEGDNIFVCTCFFHHSLSRLQSSNEASSHVRHLIGDHIGGRS